MDIISKRLHCDARWSCIFPPFFCLQSPCQTQNVWFPVSLEVPDFLCLPKDAHCLQDGKMCGFLPFDPWPPLSVHIYLSAQFYEWLDCLLKLKIKCAKEREGWQSVVWLHYFIVMNFNVPLFANILCRNIVSVPSVFCWPMWLVSIQCIQHLTC